MKWYSNRKGVCPVAPERMVRPRIAAITRATAEKRDFSKASGWRWTITGGAGDIVEFQVAA